MKVTFAGTGSAILIALAGVNGDLCTRSRQEVDGNWYCQSVQAIRYSNVGSPGSYNQITDMAPDGTCSSSPKHFSGPLAPLDEEVSLHFRGPLNLKQLAAYSPSNKSERKRHLSRFQRRGHAHQRMHNHNHLVKKEEVYQEEKRQVISATIDGQVVSWDNNWFGEKTPSTPGVSPPAVWVTATIDGQVVSWVNNWFGDSSTTANPVPTAPVSYPVTTAPFSNPITTISSAFASIPTPTVSTAAVQTQPIHAASSAKSSTGTSKPDDRSTFERIGYYDSETQHVDNLVFLGNHGGQGSGVYDSNFGASLSYINCEGNGGAAAPQVLANKAIPSDSEVVVMLGEECTNGSCGFVRPGAIAHHGFDGADKIFLIEFSMPMDDSSGFNADMPAIWMLNAQIPRTLQYGNSECSCWETGCGEFDIAEALNSGSTFLKSTIHTNKPGGDSDYFKRPTSGTMKLAVLFNSTTSSIHLQVLPDSTEFSKQLSADEIDGFCSGTPEKLVSHFAVT
ncbi:putative serine-rich protein P23A10.11c [Lachnellula suecica]|uniref:glucan endo-1,3-beta-D-glucosidase n=1 Tax=Lachnellula suecica TaxID=602035 RepID=A0A8T9C512_9HELO|nr:putative serine-rich protein P23A10.11c [Lachnellula suecica]